MSKAFYAQVTSRHDHYLPGHIVYMKPIAFKHGTPTLYSILDQRTGFTTGHEVNGNDLTNNFQKLVISDIIKD